MPRSDFANELAESGPPGDTLDRLLAGAAALDATEGMVKPITLNVLGFILKRRRLTNLGPNGPMRVVRDYIARAVDSCMLPDESRRVLKALVAHRATTLALSEMELSSRTALCLPKTRAVLAALMAAGLLRPIDRGYWAFSHDFVAKVVAEHLQTPPPETWRRIERFAAPVLLALALSAAIALFSQSPHPMEPPATVSVRESNLTEKQQDVAKLKRNGITLRATETDAIASATYRNCVIDIEKSVPILQRLRVRDLSLNSAAVTDIGALRAITGLQSLNLQGTRAANLTALQGMTELRALYLAGTPANNAEPLANLRVLKSLDLSQTAVANIEALQGLTKLELLLLTDTRVTDIGPLRDMSALQALDLSRMPLTNLTPLASLTALRTLSLSETTINDLEPLRGLPALSCLDLRLTAAS